VTSYTLFELNYPFNRGECYQRLSTLPGFSLLETGDGAQGRYDIVTAYPYDCLTLELNSNDIESALTKLKKLIQINPTSLDLPFQGGAIGYFSYDFGARLNQIQSSPQKSLQKIPLLHLGFYDWAFVIDHHLQKVSLFAANTRSETPEIVQEVLQRWQTGSHFKSEFMLNTSFSPLISKKEYHEAFESIYKMLEEGRCYQVNYTQPFNAQYSGSTWEIYQQIRRHNPVPYTAFLRLQEGDILSFSPERFLMHEDFSLLTSPIKGTAARSSESCKEDLQAKKRLRASKKNQAENVMIVDLLRNDLGKIAQPGSVKVHSLFETQSFRGVHHLVSHIGALRRENVSIIDAFLACFPGGSITGAPKLEAMHVIAEHEQYSRSVYCGSIAYFSQHGRFDSNIAIRTLVASNNILHLAAGGGIVIDSNWEDEYCECLSKIAAITHVLN
jgi:para-aminobenzoate synthetase component 1